MKPEGNGELRGPSRLQTITLLALTALGVVLCLWMAAPFLPALAWALTLAVLFTPLQVRLESKFGRSGFAALAAVFIIGLMVVVPATFVAQRLVGQAATGAELVQTKFKSGEWRRALETQPRLEVALDWVEQQVDLEGAAKAVATWLSTVAGSVVKGSVYQLIGFCLTFYLLFFFLRDRTKALQALGRFLPLSEMELARLVSRVADTIYATVYGTLAVALVQGALGGLIFWWLGLPAPLLWGVVMAVLAVVPALGAFIIWVPAAIYLLAVGSWGKALVLVLWGMLVVGTVDNLLRPVLVGNRLKLPTVLAFISVLGGLMLFGSAGLILGPVALTITTELLQIWPQRAAAAEEGDDL